MTDWLTPLTTTVFPVPWHNRNRPLGRERCRFGDDNCGTRSSPDSYAPVTYAGRETGALKLDLAVPDIEDPLLVVWSRAGVRMVRPRKNRPDFQSHFAGEGYAVASVSYRLSIVPDGVVPSRSVDPDTPTPWGTIPDHLLDVNVAVRYFGITPNSFEYDAATVALRETSSGGHLASLAGVRECVPDVAGGVLPDTPVSEAVHPEHSGRVQTVIARYPAADFRAMDPQRARIAVPRWFRPPTCWTPPGRSRSVAGLRRTRPRSSGQIHTARAQRPFKFERLGIRRRRYWRLATGMQTVYTGR